MARLELDFLRTRPAIPALSWVLLAAGVVMAVLAANRYWTASGELDREMARMRMAVPAAGHQRAAPVASGGEGESGGQLLGAPWGDLFAHLESSRPAGIALLSLEADARRGGLTLTAEARSAEDMVNYLELLRKETGFRSVTLKSHATMQDDNGRESLNFVIQAGWGR